MKKTTWIGYIFLNLKVLVYDFQVVRLRLLFVGHCQGNCGKICIKRDPSFRVIIHDFCSNPLTEAYILLYIGDVLHSFTGHCYHSFSVAK